MKHPVIGVKLKSWKYSWASAFLVGKESSWDLKQPKTIQTSLEHCRNVLAKGCLHIQELPTLATTTNLTHLPSNA